jgi:hypothetical protein
MRLPFRGGFRTVGEMRNRGIAGAGRPGNDRKGTGLPFETQDKKTRHYNGTDNGRASLIEGNHAGVACSAAMRFLRRRTTAAETPMLTRYNTTMGAMKMSMVVASGLGVITAATMEIMAIA